MCLLEQWVFVGAKYGELLQGFLIERKPRVPVYDFLEGRLGLWLLGFIVRGNGGFVQIEESGR